MGNQKSRAGRAERSQSCRYESQDHDPHSDKSADYLPKSTTTNFLPVPSKRASDATEGTQASNRRSGGSMTLDLPEMDRANSCRSLRSDGIERQGSATSRSSSSALTSSLVGACRRARSVYTSKSGTKGAKHTKDKTRSNSDKNSDKTSTKLANSKMPNKDKTSSSEATGTNYRKMDKSDRSPSSAPESALKLQQAQIIMVRRSWFMARKKGDLEPGLTIFRNIFLKSPEIREIFGGASQDKCHERLKEHALVFTEMMDKLIGNLERDWLLVEELKEIGRKHVLESSDDPASVSRDASAAGTKFRTAHLDVFATSMIERTLEWGEKATRNESSQRAWTKIVLFFVEKIKDGYSEEQKRVKRERIRKNRTSQMNITPQMSACSISAEAAPTLPAPSAQSQTQPRPSVDDSVTDIADFIKALH